MAKSKLASAADHVLPLHAGAELSVPASKTYTASLVALALISQAVDPDADFGAAIGRLAPRSAPPSVRRGDGGSPRLPTVRRRASRV